MFNRFVAASALSLAMALPLAAQEMGLGEAAAVAPETRPVEFQQIDPNKNLALKFEVRLGAKSQPAYFGSDEYVAAPDFAIKFDYARLKGLAEFGSLSDDPPARAFGLRGSLRYIGERDSSEYDEIDGLDDIDAALELGLGLVYRERNFRAFADARYGIGHDSFAGELGMDGIMYPSDNWELRAGPRLIWGANSFADTYFSVNAEEAAKSGLSEYHADGGLLGAGFEARARYRFNDLWGVEAAVRGDRLINDAADSPITGRGSRDQWTVRLGITRELILQF
ncbi:MipA/OmpV family protein [Tropicimonas sp.]|uniref:MipA/OmpV family protein n=1 Tax=Tropicimonas sp. TaxID=2067044 RepID=UPI003A8C0214